MATNPGSPGNTPNPDTLEDIKSLLADILKLQSQSADSSKISSGELLKQAESANRQLELAKARGAKEKEIAELVIKSKKAELDLINKIAEERGKYEDHEIEQIKKLNDELEKEEKTLEKINKQHEKGEGYLKRSVKGALELSKTFTSVLGNATGLSKELDSTYGVINSFVEGDIIGGVFKALTAGLEFYVSRLSAVAELVENTRASSVAATGQIQKSITTFGASLMEYGIGIEKLSESSIDLFNNMAAFSEQNEKIQKNLVGNAAKMANLGVSTSVTGKNFNELTKSLKFSSTQVTQINDKMAKAAIAAGIAPKKMLEEFSSALPKIAAYGQHGVDVYIGLQKAAKSLGMEMSTLNGIVGDQFDTFEGSARAAGKLNAVLGGNYLNSVEMLNASEEERIVMLKQALDASGKSWDSMGKFERKALAATLNITDLNEAGKLFGSSTQKLTADMKSQEITQDDLNKTQMDAATRAQKNTIAQEALMDSAVKLNDTLNETARIVREEQVEALKKMDDVFQGNIKSVTALMDKYGKIAMIIGGVVGALALIIPLIKNFSFGTSSAGNAAGASSKGLIQFGTAILLAGAGIGLAAWGLSTLVTAFKDLDPEQQSSALWALGIALGGLAIVIGVLGAVGTATAPGLGMISLALAALAADFLAIGKMLEWGGPVIIEIVKAISAAFGNFVDLIKTVVIKVLDTFMYTIDKAVQGMQVMFTGIGMLMEKASPDGIQNLLGLAAAVVALTAAFAGAAVGGLITGALTWISEKMGEKSLSEKVRDLASALKELDKGSLYNLSSVLIGFKDLSQQKVLDGSFISSLTVFSQTLNTMPEQLSKIAISLETLKGPVSVFHTLAENLREVKTELNDFPKDSLLDIKTFVDSMEKVKTIKVEDLNSAREFVVIAKDYKESQTKSFTDVFGNAIDKISSALSGNKEGEQGTKVTLVVNSRELADAIKGFGDGRISATLTGGKF